MNKKDLHNREQDAPTTPRLRFPEFREAGEWVEKSLGDTCRMQAGKFVAASDIKDQNSGDLFPCFGGNGLRGFTATHTHDGVFPLIGRQGALCGNIKLVTGSFHATEHAVVATPNRGVHVIWLYYLLDLLKLNRFATGQAQPGLSVDVLEKVPCSLPKNKPEQQRIADCLSSLDALMAAQARKVDALKTHKKGLMQQLFPRAGETQPRLRFPEFQDAGEWKTNTLGNIFETSSGGTPNRSTMEYWNGSIPWITTSLVDFNVIRCAEEFITDRGLANSSAKLFPRNTLLVALIGQGQTRGKVALLDFEASTNQNCAGILPSEVVIPKFLFFNLSSRYDQLRALSNTAGQGSLSQGLIQGLQFSYPKDKAEQQRIADCLSSLDALITAETHKLAVLKTHKQGLMQQLFPSM